MLLTEMEEGGASSFEVKYQGKVWYVTPPGGDGCVIGVDGMC